VDQGLDTAAFVFQSVDVMKTHRAVIPPVRMDSLNVRLLMFERLETLRTEERGK
jgi:hypothetical protein